MHRCVHAVTGCDVCRTNPTCCRCRCHRLFQVKPVPGLSQRLKLPGGHVGRLCRTCETQAAGQAGHLRRRPWTRARSLCWKIGVLYCALLCPFVTVRFSRPTCPQDFDLDPWALCSVLVCERVTPRRLCYRCHSLRHLCYLRVRVARQGTTEAAGWLPRVYGQVADCTGPRVLPLCRVGTVATWPFQQGLALQCGGAGGLVARLPALGLPLWATNYVLIAPRWYRLCQRGFNVMLE